KHERNTAFNQIVTVISLLSLLSTYFTIYRLDYGTTGVLSLFAAVLSGVLFIICLIVSAGFWGSLGMLRLLGKVESTPKNGMWLYSQRDEAIGGLRRALNLRGEIAPRLSLPLRQLELSNSLLQKMKYLAVPRKLQAWPIFTAGESLYTNLSRAMAK